ncbi:MAG: hypothetical protein AAF656_10265, partial [Planctomycetota bacterium]
MTYTPPTASSPDYELALRKLRRLRSVAGLLLLIILLTQIVLFFLAHFGTISITHSDAVGYSV